LRETDPTKALYANQMIGGGGWRLEPKLLPVCEARADWRLSL